MWAADLESLGGNHVHKPVWMVAPALAALLTGAAAACSSSSGTKAPAGASSSSTGAVRTFPTVPSTAGNTTPDAAADRATAQAINLRASDLPGWSGTPNSTSKSDRTMNAQMARCAGAGDPAVVDVADVSSPAFDQGEVEVSSDVTMVRSQADGRSDLQALLSPKLQACIQQVAVPYLKTQLPAGAAISKLDFQRLSPPGGLPDSFAFRLVIVVTAPGQPSVSVTSDQLGVLVGRAEIQLDDTVSGATPDASLEARLIKLLYGRARAQAGTA